MAATLLPVSTGYQDIAALLARRPDVAERWHNHLIASPFGTINASTFSFPRPTGSAIPRAPDLQFASLDMPGTSSDSSALSAPVSPNALTATPILFPEVNRSSKADRIVAPFDDEQGAEADFTAEMAVVAALADPGFAEAPSLVTRPPPSELTEAAAQAGLAPAEDDLVYAETPDFTANAMVAAAQVYFNAEQLSPLGAPLEPWKEGEEPVPVVPFSAASLEIPSTRVAPAAPPPAAETTIAVKAKDVLPTPAERLKLDAKNRAKAEKCLANAVYFEARSEPVRGQIAVAQVVLNRVFSGFYPENVCGVVYQNAHRYLACQFTFACDGIRDVVTEPEHYARAKRIARDMMDGRLWLAEVGKATHYHAMYVRPYWVRSMKKMHRYGLHTFYRPRAWGNGSDEPKWGDPAETTKLVSQL